jgi:hypothetical protein
MLRWVLLPADLLPLCSGRAAGGFNQFGWRRYSRLYRLEVPLLALCAICAPLRLVSWVAAMVLAFLTSMGKPAAN